MWPTKHIEGIIEWVEQSLAVKEEGCSTTRARQAWWICSPSVFLTRLWRTSRICAVVIRASERIQSLDHRLHFLLSDNLLDMLFCVSLSQVITRLTPTMDSLRFLCLIRFVANASVEKIHRDFDNRFIHSDCRRHSRHRLRGDSGTEVANGLENLTSS